MLIYSLSRSGHRDDDGGLGGCNLDNHLLLCWPSLPCIGCSYGRRLACCIDRVFTGDRWRTLIVVAFKAVAQVWVTPKPVVVANTVILLAEVLFAIAAFADSFFQDLFLL